MMLLHSQQHYCDPIALRTRSACTETKHSKTLLFRQHSDQLHVLQYVNRSSVQVDKVSSGAVHRDKDVQAVL